MEKKNNIGLIIVLVVVIVALLASGGFFTFKYFNNKEKSPEEIIYYKNTKMTEENFDGLMLIIAKIGLTPENSEEVNTIFNYYLIDYLLSKAEKLEKDEIKGQLYSVEKSAIDGAVSVFKDFFKHEITNLGITIKEYKNGKCYFYYKPFDNNFFTGMDVNISYSKNYYDDDTFFYSYNITCAKDDEGNQKDVGYLEIVFDEKNGIMTFNKLTNKLDYKNCYVELGTE